MQQIYDARISMVSLAQTLYVTLYAEKEAGLRDYPPHEGFDQLMGRGNVMPHGLGNNKH